MAKTLWLVTNKKISLIIMMVVIILGILFFKGFQYWQETRIDPEELFYAALQRTTGAESFRYRIQTELGGERPVSTVTGRCTAPGSVHLQGNLEDTEFELIHIGDKTYFKESETGRWFTLTGNKMVDSKLFVELNPLQNFNFKDIPQINFRGLEKLDREKLALLTMKPNINNQFLLTRFNNFTYQVWIDPQKQYIRKAIIEASAWEKEQEKETMKISIDFWDYNQQMEITPPADH